MQNKQRKKERAEKRLRGGNKKELAE